MKEFFKGWRRKLGVVTLLMACVFMAGWLVIPGSWFEDETVGLDFTISAGATGFSVNWQGFSSTFGLSSEFEWLIPYWSVTIPLTLISLWLLLSKPRKSNQREITEPTPKK
jgi:hypothetical protein